MRNADGEDRRQADDKWVIKPKCGLKACVHPNCLESVSRKQEQRLRGLKAGQAAAKAKRVGEEQKKYQRYSKASVICLLCETRIWDTGYFRNQHNANCSATAATGQREVKLKFEPVSFMHCNDCGEFVINQPDPMQAHYRNCQPGTA